MGFSEGVDVGDSVVFGEEGVGEGAGLDDDGIGDGEGRGIIDDGSGIGDGVILDGRGVVVAIGEGVGVELENDEVGIGVGDGLLEGSHVAISTHLDSGISDRLTHWRALPLTAAQQLPFDS